MEQLGYSFWLTSLSALIGLCCLPIGLSRILLGALGNQKGDQVIRSGMSFLSLGIFLLIVGVICHPGLNGL